MATKEKSVKTRRAEAIWAIVWNIVFLIILNKIPDWDLKFITEKYDLVLWVLNLNILIQIGGYFICIFLTMYWLWQLIRALLDAASLVVFLVLYFLYPFNFAGIDGWTWLDTVIPIALIVGMIASGLGMVIHFFKLMFGLSK